MLDRPGMNLMEFRESFYFVHDFMQYAGGHEIITDDLVMLGFHRMKVENILELLG
jgi:hypothetical protein